MANVLSARRWPPFVRAWRGFSLTLLALAVTPLPALAQNRDYSTYDMFGAISPEIVAVAFAQPYGRALAARFATALTASADKKCLKTKGIAIAKVRDRARAMLLERGAYLIERASAMLDRVAFKDYLRARIGSEGVAEFERMPNDPVVQAYLNADEPAKLVYIAIYVVENIRRYTMLARIELARPISPWERSFPSLDKLDPTDKIDRTLKQMIEGDKTGVLARYFEMTVMAQKPHRDATHGDSHEVRPRRTAGSPRQGQHRPPRGVRRPLRRAALVFDFSPKARRRQGAPAAAQSGRLFGRADQHLCGPGAIELRFGLALNVAHARDIRGIVFADHATTIHGPIATDPADIVEFETGAIRFSTAVSSSCVSGVSKARSTMTRGMAGSPVCQTLSK